MIEKGVEFKHLLYEGSLKCGFPVKSSDCYVESHLRMRKLFARVTGTVNSNRRETDQIIDDSLPIARSTRSTASTAVTTEDQRRNEAISDLILVSAQTLMSAIQEILCDTASLQDSMTGFIKLLAILDVTETDSNLSNMEAATALDSLLSNLKYPLFAEKCNETGLVTALMHALRLLRMYEIKLAKNSMMTSRNEDRQNSGQGVTFAASRRLCLVFSTLLADQKTTEKIRSSLVKLVTFPLSALPERGISFIKLGDHHHELRIL